MVAVVFLELLFCTGDVSVLLAGLVVVACLELMVCIGDVPVLQRKPPRQNPSSRQGYRAAVALLEGLCAHICAHICTCWEEAC